MIIINDENDHIKIFLNQNSLSKIQQQQIQATDNFIITIQAMNIDEIRFFEFGILTVTQALVHH